MSPVPLPPSRTAARVALASAALAFALHAGLASSSPPPVAAGGQPAVLAPAAVARLLPVAEVAAREQLVAAGLVALAAALVAWSIAAARGDRGGALGGLVAGLWLASTPPAWALAGAVSAATVALFAGALALAAHDRLARGGGPSAAGALGVGAALALLADPRAVLPLAVAVALIAYRGRRGARWVALAPALGGGLALAMIAAAAIVGGPRWPASPRELGLEPWLAVAVDELGPVALVVGGLGVAALCRTVGERWQGIALALAVATAAPPTVALSPVAVVALALGLGHATAQAARLAEATAAAPRAWARPAAVAVVLAVVAVVPPSWRRATDPPGRDRARVSSYAAPRWTSSPVTRR